MLSVLIDWLPGLGWLKKESVIRVLYPVFQQYLVYLEEEMKMKSNNQVRINLPFYLSTCLPEVLSEICLGGGSASVRAWKPSKIHRFLWSRGMSPHSPPLLSTYLPIYQSTYLPIYLSTYLTIYPSTYLPIYLSTYLPIYLTNYLPIYLSTHLPINLPSYLLTSLPNYLPTYLPTNLIYLRILTLLQLNLQVCFTNFNSLQSLAANTM